MSYSYRIYEDCDDDYNSLWSRSGDSWDSQSRQPMAIHQGELVHIDKFWHLKDKSPEYRNQFEFHCPVCGEDMHPRHSKIVSSYFRHWDGKSHHPETVAHSSAKKHIASVLERGGTLSIAKKCGECDQVKWIRTGFGAPLLKSDFDNVQVEVRVGRFTPDISLWKNGACVLAIEVAYSNKSSDEKLAYFDQMGIPWVELSVKYPSRFQELMRWKGGKNLFRCFSKRSGQTPDLCLECVATAPQRAAEKLAREQAAQELARIASEERRIRWEREASARLAREQKAAADARMKREKADAVWANLRATWG